MIKEFTKGFFIGAISSVFLGICIGVMIGRYEMQQIEKDKLFAEKQHSIENRLKFLEKRMTSYEEIENDSFDQFEAGRYHFVDDDMSWGKSTISVLKMYGKNAV